MRTHEAVQFEALILGKLSQDFVESVYSLSLEHSRASWSDTNTLIDTCHSLGNLGVWFHGLGHQGVSRVILPYILQKL